VDTRALVWDYRSASALFQRWAERSKWKVSGASAVPSNLPSQNRSSYGKDP